ncbi:ABC transporter permease [Anaerolineales bacterium HSG25]|nr:ABC transporter permease [Anaerolineales bacterium HSG25]
MLKLLNIAREEIWYHARQWTFYLVTFGVPLMFAALGAIPRIQVAAEDAPLPNVETVFTIDETITEPTGYVDHADLITFIPDDLSENLFPFADEASADHALQAEEIESYYVIASNYISSGVVTQYSHNPQLLAHTDGPIRALLRDNLMETVADPLIAERLEMPVYIINNGPPPPQYGFLPLDLDLRQLFSASLIVSLFAYTINVSGSLLIRSLQREMKMRVMEILITSTTPHQFIGGKLVGLISLALFQVSLSLLAAAWVYGNNPDGSGPARLSLIALAYCVPYLFFGLIAYCGVVMSMAAVWPNPRESGLLLGGARIIAMSPLVGILFILPDLDGWLAVVLTIFPLTATLLMPFRLLLSGVPMWQWLIGLAGLMFWSFLTVSLSMQLFRTRGLLTGQSTSIFNLRRIIRVVQGV